MDDIQRKLALIDAQLTGRAELHTKIVATAPLLPAAIGLIIGIQIQHAFDLPLPLWLILLTLFAASAVLLFVIETAAKLGSYALVLLSSCALICFVCLGAIRLVSFYEPRPNDIRNLVKDQPKLATIRGLVVTEPYISRNRHWRFAKFKYTDPSSTFYLKVTQVKTADNWTAVAGTARVWVDEPVLDLKSGDSIQLYCWLDKHKQPTNPGQFNTAAYLARKNIFIVASIKSRDGIEVLEGIPASIFTRVKRKLRRAATQTLLADISPEDPSHGLLQALLLGYRKDINSTTYEAFRKTGLLHFISLSGMHLGILMGIIWYLCKTAGLMKRSRAVICIMATVIFLLIVPPRAPTLRAAIISLVFCLSFFFRRRPNPLNTLALAAVVLLLIRPTQLFEAGWQLSFASVLGILLLSNRIHFFLYEKITSLPWHKKAPKTRLFLRIILRPGPYILRLLSVGIAAWIGGAGILLYHFYTVTPLTCIWTVVVFPLIAATLTTGFLKIIISLLLPSVAALLNVVVTVFAHSLIRIVESIASWDISEILIGKVGKPVVVLYYTAIILIIFVHLQRPLIRRGICTVMLAAIIAFLGVTKWQRICRNDLVITCFDVGHGQAILARLPRKANVIFDAGSLHKSDIGRQIVTAFLNYSGINEVDAIIISHNDIDHINGIPEITENCKVHNVYANDAFFKKTERWGAAKFLKTSLSEKGLEIQPMIKDLNIAGSTCIKTLWPNQQTLADDELADNDKSMVLSIEFAGRRVLLGSDIEKFAQRELLRTFPNLKAEVVVVPHHGSTNTLDSAFLQNLEADILIFSCGQRQYEKWQESKQRNKTKSFFTARDGAVTIQINKNGTIETDSFVK